MPRLTKERPRMRIGYARVSTAEQSLDLQRNALRQAGCERIFEDHGVSGSAMHRSGLDEALDALAENDTLVVWRLDRLGRSLVHLIDTVNLIAAKGGHFQSLNEAIDTASSGGRLVFHIMGALAEFERALISDRTKAGMAAARRAGTSIGRPRALTQKQIDYAREALAERGDDLGTLADLFGVHPRTLARALDKA